jgi:hypothetical protein
MKYKNVLIERGALQEPPYPAMGGECPLLPTEECPFFSFPLESRRMKGNEMGRVFFSIE